MVLVDHAELFRFTRECLIKSGSSAANSIPVAEVLVEADLRAVYSHGTNRLDLYCDELLRGAVHGSIQPVIATEAPATAVIDGRNAQGAVVGKMAMELAIKKAKECGVAWVVARNSNHYGIAGWYAMMASEQGMIGMSMTNTSPVCTPTRSSKPAIGTNPIACAAPTNGPPVVLDMATPTVPFGKVELKHRKGEKCPPGWGVDSAGQQTTDPSKIIFGGGVTPLGGAEITAGYKGYGLGLMVEMLSGVLANSLSGPDLGMAMNPNAVDRTEPVNLGQCFVAIDPEKFCPGYPDRMQRLVDQMHGLPRAEDAPGPVLVPGDVEREADEKQKVEGIDIHQNVAATLVALGEKLGVPIPKGFAGIAGGKVWGNE